MKLSPVVSVFSGLGLSLVLVVTAAPASAGSQLDDLVKALRPVSAIHSASQGSDYIEYPREPNPGASPGVQLLPTLLGAQQAGHGTLQIGLDQGLPLNVFSMLLGKNRPEITLFLVDLATINGAIQQQLVAYLYNDLLASGRTAEEAFALKLSAYDTRNLIDPYVLKPRHLLSSATLSKINELHNLPFRILFSIFVEKDTGQIVCRVLVAGRNRKISLIQKGATFEQALTAGVVRLYHDRLLLVAEDLARNDFAGFQYSYLNSVNSRTRGSLWPHVQGAGYSAQLFRAGRMTTDKVHLGLTLDDVVKTARYFPTITAEEAALIPLPMTTESDEPFSDLEDSEY